MTQVQDWQWILYKYCPEMNHKLDMDDLLMGLISENLVTHKERDEIKAAKTKNDKILKMLDVLSLRGQNKKTFKRFLKALTVADQHLGHEIFCESLRRVYEHIKKMRREGKLVKGDPSMATYKEYEVVAQHFRMRLSLKSTSSGSSEEENKGYTDKSLVEAIRKEILCQLKSAASTLTKDIAQVGEEIQSVFQKVKEQLQDLIQNIPEMFKRLQKLEEIESETFRTTDDTMLPQPSTLLLQSSTLPLQPSTLPLQPSTLPFQPSTLPLQPSTLPSTLLPQITELEKRVNKTEEDEEIYLKLEDGYVQAVGKGGPEMLHKTTSTDTPIMPPNHNMSLEKPKKEESDELKHCSVESGKVRKEDRRKISYGRKRRDPKI